MDYQLTHLKNGVRLLTVPMPSLESVTVTVWAKVGSRWEEASTAGLSHFLEHMVFKGSQKRPSAREIAEAVDSIGGEFNAATSKEWTNFYIRSRTANLPIIFDLLSDMVLNPMLKSEDIEREKGVILEEIAMYEDTPMYNIGNIFERLIFAGNSLGRDVIGTKETVKSVQRDDFVRYRDTYYDSQNLVITVAGGVTEAEVLKLAEKHFVSVHPKNRKQYDRIKIQQKSPQVLLHQKKSDQAHLILGFPGFERGHPRRFAEAILSTVLGGGMSSRLFQEVREKRGLAYAVRADVDHYMDTGYFSVYAGVDLKRIDEAVEVIHKECLKVAKNASEIGREELDRAKEYLRGHLALSLESTRAVNTFFGEQLLFLPKIQTPEEVFAEIDKVTSHDLYDLAREIFVPKKANLAVIGPFENEERFVKLLT